MIIPVIWQSYDPKTPSTGFWDMAMLEAIFERKLWQPVKGFEFSHYSNINHVDGASGAVLIIPARSHAGFIEQINRDIARFNWILIILVGDEEQVFPIDKLVHPRMKVWAMTPNMNTQADRFLINGWSPETRDLIEASQIEYATKPLSWAFSGQVTHRRREECVTQLRDKQNGFLLETKAFLSGLSRTEYFSKMTSAKVAPCPSGAIIPDSFRVYEALEAGCLPILDGLDPKGGSQDYWKFLFGEEFPMPVLEDWTALSGTIDYFVDTFPIGQNRTFAWWQKFKRKMVYNLEEDIAYLAQVTAPEKSTDDRITVLIPTSPTHLHPETGMIQETIESVRSRLPNAEIIIMIDGIRDEQSAYKENYQEYIRRLLWLCNFEYKNILPLVFDQHTHQVGMTKEALKLVKTDCILFVEHDTPLCEDIPFGAITDSILAGDANMVRLHHEALILDVHKDLMLDTEPQQIHGIPMVRTGQWSQRPHVAGANFYREMLLNGFSANAKSMIEDGIHGKVNEAFRRRGKAGWNEWKVWIYAPAGDMKRSYHTDGRGQDSKFDSTFIY